MKAEKNSISKSVSIFVGLAVVFAALVAAASFLPGGLAQMILISVGSAVFGAGLTYFLIRLS